MTTLYDDGRVACTADALLVRWYYLWGHKRIPYDAIRAVESVDLGPATRWRIWGSSDLRHWWHLDRTRPKKRTGLTLEVGTRARPAITPDDPEAVEEILRSRISS